MKNIPEPMKSILHDYCHVEWPEIGELFSDVKNRNKAFNVDALKEQFQEMISSDDLPFLEINELTFNEFESATTARIWLEDIYRQALA